MEIRMQYKVVPFQARISGNGGGGDVASQLEGLIVGQAGSGWEYVRLETVETHVAGSSGCFGLGATPGQVTSYPVAVFRQS
jgi:hypothetical protein